MGHGLASFRGVGMALARRTALYHTRKWFSVKSGEVCLAGDGNTRTGSHQQPEVPLVTPPASGRHSWRVLPSLGRRHLMTAPTE